MSLDQLFTVEEYARCLNVANRRYGWMLNGLGFTAPEMVHELYIRLHRNTAGWASRRHFRATCELALRHIAIDLSRSRRPVLRNLAGLDESRQADAGSGPRQELQLELKHALSLLRARRPRHYSVIRHRFLDGLTVEETAQRLGVSPRTVRRDTAGAVREFRLIWEYPQSV